MLNVPFLVLRSQNAILSKWADFKVLSELRLKLTYHPGNQSGK